MSPWEEEIDRELRRAGMMKHPGQLRTVARRVAGIALRQLPDVRTGISGHDDVVMLLKIFSGLSGIPEAARTAAIRLYTRLDADFSSPSKDPIADARIIIDYVRAFLSTAAEGL